MRALPLLFPVLLSFLCSSGQSYEYDRWHVGWGLTEATVNFQQNGAGGFAFPMRYDLLRSANASLSLGTNFKIGSEDKYGLGFPLILALLLAGDNSGSYPDISTLGGSTHGTAVTFFSDLPLLLNYNWGLGESQWPDRRFGFYLGGGVSATITGSPNSAGNQHSASFFGWVSNIGIRFAKNKDLGFSATVPINNNVGIISNPVFYQLTFSAFFR